MADGDAVIKDIVACNYSDDFGNFFRRKVFSHYQTQAALGWTLLSNRSYHAAPRGLDPRSWIMVNATDPARRARAVVATNAAYYAGVLSTTTLAMIYRGVEETMALAMKEGERFRGQVDDVVVQETAGA